VVPPAAVVTMIVEAPPLPVAPPAGAVVTGTVVPPAGAVVTGTVVPPDGDLVPPAGVPAVKPGAAVVPASPGSPSVDDCAPPAPPCGPSELAPEQAISPTKSVNNENSEKRRRVGMIFLNG
jgi:hypothetical protein